MKKYLLIMAAMILCLTLMGCSTTMNNHENGYGTSPVLVEDEYYIYENGEAIAALSDYGERRFLFSVPSIDNDDYEIVVDFEDREITTKRGIKIGSTIREFVNAYKYCEISLIDQDLIVNAEDFLENIDDYDLESEYVISMGTYLYCPM